MARHVTPDALTPASRILIVAPSWVGDAILSEPLVALLRDPYEDADRRRAGARVVRAGLRAHARHRPHHRDARSATASSTWRGAAALARDAARAKATRARSSCPIRGSRRSCPGSRASRGAPATRRGALRAAQRRAPARPRRRMPRLVDRFAALAGTARRAWCRCRRAPVLVPDVANRAARDARAATCKTDRPVAILCPGAEFGAGQALAARAFRRPRARCSCATACRCGSSARRTTSSPPTRCWPRRATTAQRDPRPHRPHRPRHRDRPPVARRRSSSATTRA